MKETRTENINCGMKKNTQKITFNTLVEVEDIFSLYSRMRTNHVGKINFKCNKKSSDLLKFDDIKSYGGQFVVWMKLF